MRVPRLAVLCGALCTAVCLMGLTTGGFPSNPTFQSVQIGAPTGGNKGPGSINAQSAFVNNIALLTTTGNAATATALAAAPSTCTLPNVALGIAANGNASCVQPSNVTGVASGNPTLSSSNTWTNTNTFSGLPNSGTGSSYVSCGLFAASAPACAWDISTAGLNGKLWLAAVDGLGDWILESLDDTAANPKNALFVSRTGTTIATIAIGNATDNPTVTINGAAYAPGAAQTSGTYTATLSTGCTTSPTTTAKWVKIGSMVVVNFGNFGTCTSNSTLTSLDASVPAAERPASNQCLQAVPAENNTVLTGGSFAMARVLTTGVIDFEFDDTGCAGAGWTASGTKGLGAGFTLSWQTAN